MNIQKIAQEAFVDELEKLSGKKTELAGAFGLAPINGPLLPVSMIAAMITPNRKKADIEKQNKKTWSNFIPGVAPYRIIKRVFRGD